MTIQRKFKSKDKNSMVWFRSGHIYSFRYLNFENDPEPVILCLYALKGRHPSTNHYWNFVQGINFNYIPRMYRKQFVKTWIGVLEKNHGNIRLTWEMLLRRFPYLAVACRRYSLDNRMFRDLKEIPIEDIEAVVVSTWAKDYSKQAYRAILKKYKRASKYLKSILTGALSGLIPEGPYYRKEITKEQNDRG